MSNIKNALDALLKRILKGRGEAAQPQRKAAFEHSGLSGPVGMLVDKVAWNAQLVTDEDIAAVKRTGLTEDQIFEIVVCAAVGESMRIYEGGLEALRDAGGKDKHAP